MIIIEIVFRKNFAEEIERLGLPDHSVLPTGHPSEKSKPHSSVDSLKQTLQPSNTGALVTSLGDNNNGARVRSLSAYNRGNSITPGNISDAISSVTTPPSNIVHAAATIYSGYSIFVRRGQQSHSRETVDQHISNNSSSGKLPKRASTGSHHSSNSSTSGQRASLNSKTSFAKLGQAVGWGRNKDDRDSGSHTSSSSHRHVSSLSH